jgi:uncharacterized protein DUF2799
VWASRTASSLALAVLLAGCATLGKDECLHADWYAIGIEDGAGGKALERLGEHRRACAKHAIAPDADRYVAGRDHGLESFCTQQSGFTHGRAGHAYGGVCPASLSRNFLAGYQRGRELYESNRRLTELEREISRIKNALKEGIPNPRTRAMEVERLEALTREAEQLENHISQMKGS